LAQGRGGAELQTGGILEYFEDLRPTKRVGSDGPSRNAGKRGTNPAGKGGRPKDVFEIASKTALFAFLIIVFIPVLVSCGDSQQQDESTAPAAVMPESFTFFDLGINSRLNKKVRQELGDKLGRDAIEQRSILDLEINYKGFLDTYFPVLSELNRSLNFPPGERVEHNTVKLMYRYALKKNVPFDYVELVFSNYTKTPIFFKINFREDEAGIIKTLESKYGQPQAVSWKEENGNSMYWMRNGDFLIVSLVPDQFGNPTYQIVIYFVKNLEQLIAAEKAERKEKSLERTQSGKTAF
jgi:hypothetical protein